MASTSDIKVGSVIRYNGELCIVQDKQHTMPGKGGAFYQVKMKSIQSGRSYENRFRSGESVDIARLVYTELQYIYEEGEHFVCMNQESYEQIHIPKSLFGDNAKFLKESMIVKVGFESDQPIIAEAPTFVELEITYSEPGIKGDTATNTMKPATLETGAEIKVPLFVNEGDKIKIDTRTGEYMERVKKLTLRFSQPITANDLAEKLGGKCIGDSSILLLGINEIHRVEQGDVTFCDNLKYLKKSLDSNASCVLVNESAEAPAGKVLILVEDSFLAFTNLSKELRGNYISTEMIDPLAKIGMDTVVMPGTFIGKNVVIGDNCIIHPNVTIYDGTEIGNDVIIHSGTVIGADAFYYQRRERYTKLHSSGNVIIKDAVEIGAACTIDRGVTSCTVIGAGTKMDNMVQIGHDTVIGENCLFASQVGIAGVVNVEDNVILWGQVGVQKDLTIGKGAVVLGQSGLAKSLEGGITYFGSPVQEARAKMKELALLKQLPEIVRELRS